MESFGFSAARVDLLERDGRVREAAEIYLAQGQPAKAIRLLIPEHRKQANKELYSYLEHYFSRSIWKQLSFGEIWFMS